PPVPVDVTGAGSHRSDALGNAGGGAGDDGGAGRGPAGRRHRLDRRGAAATGGFPTAAGSRGGASPGKGSPQPCPGSFRARAFPGRLGRGLRPGRCRMTAPLTIIGDTLLDRDVGGEVFRLAPDAPVPVVDESCARSRPGGAGLAALLAARSGRETTLVTALGNDEAGAEVAGLLEDAGVRLVDIGTSASTPEKIRIHGQG